MHDELRCHWCGDPLTAPTLNWIETTRGRRACCDGCLAELENAGEIEPGSNVYHPRLERVD